VPIGVGVASREAGRWGSAASSIGAAIEVERGFNRRKQLRAVATRYDKLKRRYEATLTIALILDWLRATPDGSRS
jgi:transposase